MSVEVKRKLEEERAHLANEISDFQTKYAGDTPVPQADLSAMDAKAQRYEEINAELKRIDAEAEQKARIDAAYESSRESAGHAPLVATQTSTETKTLVLRQDGQVGVKGLRGNFFPLADEAYWETRKDWQHIATPQYKAAFEHYLREGEKFLSPQEHALLLHTKALSESSNTGGGFATPIDYIPRVIERRAGPVTFTARASHITTNRDVVLAPRVKGNTGTYNTMYPNAVVATWVSENPADTAGNVDPVFEAVSITVNTAKLTTKLSRNLVADAAFNVQTWLQGAFNVAAQLHKDQAFLIGTGTAQPLGVAVDPDITQVKTGSNTALTADDPKNMLYGLPVQYWAGAEFWLSLAALKTYRTMKDGNGNYIWSPGFDHGMDNKVPGTLEGLPYNVTDFLGGVTQNAIPMVLGNPEYYWVVDRLDLSIQVLNELYVQNNQIGYVGFLRCGGHVSVPDAFRQLIVST